MEDGQELLKIPLRIFLAACGAKFRSPVSLVVACMSKSTISCTSSTVRPNVILFQQTLLLPGYQQGRMTTLKT